MASHGSKVRRGNVIIHGSAGFFSVFFNLSVFFSLYAITVYVWMYIHNLSGVLRTIVYSI